MVKSGVTGGKFNLSLPDKENTVYVSTGNILNIIVIVAM